MTLSLWLDEPYKPRDALRGDLQVPVVVIGGGITGISTAYWLGRSGVPCAVLEQGTVACGATGRNAGFVLEGTVPDYGDLVARFGRAEARALWAFTVENRERMVQVSAEEGIEAEIDRCGSVWAAASPQELDALRREAELLVQEGFPLEVLDAEEVAARLGGRGGFLGGVLNPRDMGIHPVRLTRGLAHAGERRGARIFEGTPALELERRSHWEVKTPGGRVRADHVVVALDAYAGLLDNRWASVIRAVRGQVLATAPAGRRLFPHLFYANEGFEYWRQTPAGRVVLGGLRRLALQEEVGTEDRLHPRIQEALEAYLRDLGVPPEVSVTHRWSGAIGISVDHLPLIGPVPGSPGLFLAAGYTGHGLAFAFLAGRMVAQLVATGNTEYPHALFPQRVLAAGPRTP